MILLLYCGSCETWASADGITSVMENSNVSYVSDQKNLPAEGLIFPLVLITWCVRNQLSQAWAALMYSILMSDSMPLCQCGWPTECASVWAKMCRAFVLSSLQCLRQTAPFCCNLQLLWGNIQRGAIISSYAHFNETKAQRFYVEGMFPPSSSPAVCLVSFYHPYCLFLLSF